MLTAVGSANAAPVLDQEYSPDPNTPPVGHAAVGQNSVSRILNRGQTFTIGITGILSAIEVRVAKNPNIIEDLTLDLRTTNGSLPGLAGATLATAVLSAGDIPDSVTSFISFDLSAAGIDVTAGDFLSFVLSSPTLHSNPASYFISNSGAEGGYDGGEGFWASYQDGNNFEVLNDLFFRTFVEVSEPGSLAVLGLGLFVLASARRRHPDNPWSARVCVNTRLSHCPVTL
jgi:hypothetical protein